MKFNLKFVISTLIITIIIVPVLFNIFFLWESGLSRGETSDWFTLYGNIFGGLIGGFFTYLALLLTLNDQKENKKKEMRPKIDIPYQSIDFIDSEFNQIVIELNNIGGSIAKNIECTLSLPNYDEVLEALKQSKAHFGIDLILEDSDKSAHLIEYDKEGKMKTSFGGVYKEYNAEFIGSCIPLVLNHEAKTNYILKNNVENWINYIVKNRNYTKYNEQELFNFILEVKYSSDEFGEITDCFKLGWGFKGIMGGSSLKYQYVLKSTKVDNFSNLKVT